MDNGPSPPSQDTPAPETAPDPAAPPERRRILGTFVHPRPFAGIRVIYWLLALAGGFAIAAPAWNGQDGETVRYVIVAVILAAGLCEACVRKRMPGDSPAPKRFFIGMLALGLWSVLFSLPLVGMSCGCDYTPRTRVVETILSGSEAKTAIGARFAATGTLSGAGHGITIPVSSRVAAASVSEDGAITLTSPDPPAVITMTPGVAPVDGVPKVVWTCKGQPVKVMPASCR